MAEESSAATILDFPSAPEREWRTLQARAALYPSVTSAEMMSERGVRSLHALYAGAPIEYRRIAPREIGVPRIGHFGFFRQQLEPSLWPLVPEWLGAPARANREQTQASGGGGLMAGDSIASPRS